MTLTSPFNLPEICIRLAPFLDNASTLNCMLVCREWYHSFLPALYSTLPLSFPAEKYWRSKSTNDAYSTELWDRIMKHPKLLQAPCRCDYREKTVCIHRIALRFGQLVRELIIIDPAALSESSIQKLQGIDIHSAYKASRDLCRLALKGQPPRHEDPISDELGIFPLLRRLEFQPLIFTYHNSTTLQHVNRFMGFVKGSKSTLQSLSENWAAVSQQHHHHFVTLFLKWLLECSGLNRDPLLSPTPGTRLIHGIKLTDLRLTSWKISLEALSQIIDLCPCLDSLTLANVEVLSPGPSHSPDGPLSLSMTQLLKPMYPLENWKESVLDTKHVRSLTLTEATIPTHLLEFRCTCVRELFIDIKSGYSPKWDADYAGARSTPSTRFTWTLPRVERIKYFPRLWDPLDIFGASIIDYPATALGWSRSERIRKNQALLARKQMDSSTARQTMRPIEEWPTDNLQTFVYVGAKLTNRQLSRLTYPTNQLVNLNLSWDSRLSGRGILRILSCCSHLRRLVIAGVYLWLDEYMDILTEKEWVCHNLKELSILVSISRQHATEGDARCPFQFHGHLSSSRHRKADNPGPYSASQLTSRRPKGSSNQQIRELHKRQGKQLQEQARKVDHFLQQYQNPSSEPLCIDHPAVPLFLKRISEMVKLEELNLGEGYNHSNLCCGLPWTIGNGLEMLHQLAEMRVLHLTSWVDMMGIPEVNWMKAHWPQLKGLIIRDHEVSRVHSESLRSARRETNSQHIEIGYRSEYKSVTSDELYFSPDRDNLQ